MLIFLSSLVNAPFLLALVIAFLFVGMTLLGLLHDVDGGIDLDGDGVADIHLDGADSSWVGWIGIGRVPLTVVLITFLFAFGLGGLGVNALAHDLLSDTWKAPLFPFALLVGAVSGVLSARAVATTIVRILPAGDSEALRPGMHVGRVGTTLCDVTNIGQVRVEEDARGPVAYLNVRPEKPLPIAKDVEVLVTRFDLASQLYLVTPTSEIK